MKPKTNKDAWFEQAWAGRDNITVTHEMMSGKDVVRPGTLIRFKNIRGTFKFRCLVHNTARDVTWIDCIDSTNGTWRAFYAHKLKGVVKAKRSRRKKANV